MAEMTLNDVAVDMRAYSLENGASFSADECDQIARLIDAAIKQREHDAKDAARYRWLLGTHDKLCEPIQDMWTEVTHSGREYPTKNEWDSAIDAAMAEESVR